MNCFLSYTMLTFFSFLFQDYLQACLEQIEQMVQKTIEERDEGGPNGRAAVGTDTGMSWTHPHNTPEKMVGKAGTPTDVRDVHF